jgi:hypothetical protein
MVGEFGARDYLVVPGGEVDASRGDFFFVLFVGHAIFSNSKQSTAPPAKASARHSRKRRAASSRLSRLGGLAFRRRLLNYCAVAIHWPAA